MKKGFFETLAKACVPLITGILTACTGASDGVAPGGTASGGGSVIITPNAVTLMATNNYTFSASGGSGSYSYSIASGGGSVLATTGVYTAPGAAGTDVVRVVDGSGAYADAIVTIRPVLQISPAGQSVVLNGTISFSAVGGVNPLVYSVSSGGGSVNSTSGLYTAPNSAGSAVVTVTDALGNTSTSNVTISNALAISPSSYTLAVSNTHTFSASGGTAPYTFSVFSGGGSINSSGLYTAPGASGSAVIRVTDSLGATADAAVTINAALAISPSSKTLAVNNVFTFSASGGVSPYTYSVLSGGGSINSSSGSYTAPAASGNVTVRVTDSLGNTSDAAVTINSALQISPASQSVALNGTINFSTSGGVAPVTYSVPSGGGSVNSSGVYTAPNTAGSATVRATDSLGNTSDATVTITNVLAISPSSYTLAVNNTKTFSASGGTAPYTYSVFSGGGSIDSSGLYTAPGTAGSAVVRVTDSLGATADASVIINAALAISPASKILAVNNLFTFTASGGVSPYTFTITGGGGSINSSSGAYTAPGAAGSATVRVTDSLGNTSDASVTINAALQISPASQSVALNGTINFSTTGGVTPVSYSVTSGGGSVVSGTGVYTAPGTAGSATVRATDSLGNTSDASITITNVLSISPTSYTLAVNNTHTFSASGGSSPYTFSVFSGGGSINSSGLYTAPATSGSAVVRVTDSLGATADASVTINAALAISPTSTSLGINSTKTFSAAGGVSPYSYSVFSGGGSVNSSGVYTAPGTAGSAVVRVTDNVGNTADANVTITAALQISPSSSILAVNNTASFSASGGTSPYTYSVLSGGGSINSSGVYTAPGTSGSATVRVTDNVGATSDAVVTINPALAISPASITLVLNATTTFSATGGVSPYTYSKTSGVGSIDSATGVYTAPATSGTAVVRVTDSLGNISSANVTVTNALTISPSTPVYVETDGTLTFSATGGSGPYSFACTSSATAIDAVTGDYIAPSTAGSDVCTVTDSLSAASSATVTVYSPLTLSPTTVTMGVNTTQTFTASGGQGTRTFSLVSGVGSIDSTTGVYTAPSSSGSAVIQVADTIGNVLEASITVVGSLTIAPKDMYLAVGSKVTSYTATLGAAPYTFTVESGGGSIVSTSQTGTYTAPATSGTGVVKVTDSLTATDTATVYHIVPVDIISSWGASHVCALYAAPVYANYKLKCWGYNNAGQLGLGDTNSRGDSTTEQGSGLPFVNLGTNKFVKKVAVGTAHTCAILDDNTVKCWGSNSYGQLGYGNTTTKGTAASQMGDNLTSVNLGTGRTATDIYAFGYRTCAILDNSVTKCWGRNITGQLGLGDTNNRGDSAGEMGDSLPAVDFGTGRYAVKLAGTESTTCGLLDNGTLKCFGLGQTGTYGGISHTYYGELGLETNNKTWGDGASEMGDNLPTVSVGLTGGDSVVDIAAGRYHYCVTISSGSVKCWGRNNLGQLGIDNTTNKGDTVSSMGTNLVAAIGISNATTLSLMRESSCVKITGGTEKCWGSAGNAQLLTGSGTNGAAKNVGDASGEMSGVTNINFGTGLTSSKIAGGSVFACGILSNNFIKCWGATTCGAGNTGVGCLLNGSTSKTDIGDSSTEVGNNLLPVNH